MAFALLVAGVFFAVEAYAAATFTGDLTISNPGPALNNANADFTFPLCLTPLEFGGDMTWNQATRVLSIDIGSIGENETKTFTVTMQSESDGCSVSGTLSGEFAEQSGAGEPLPPEEVVPEEEKPVEEELPPGLTAPDQGEGGGYVSLNFLPNAATQLLTDIRSATTVVSAVRQVLEPVSQAATAVSVTAITVNATSAGSQLVISWLNYLRFFFLGYVRRKRSLPWGRVIDEWTGRPINGAVVSVIDPAFNHVRESQPTDQEGRFGFLATAGRYILKASKNGFTTKETGIFEVGNDPSKLNLEIKLAQEGSTILVQSKVFALRFFSFINNLLYYANPYVLAAGTLISFGSFLVIPTKLNLAIVVIYLILDVLKFVFSRNYARSYGLVVDAVSKLPVPLSVIRLFNADRNWLIGTRVSDNDGRFNFLLLPGRYYMTCVNGGYQELKTPISEVSKAAAVSQTLTMTPVQSAPITPAPAPTAQ